MTEYDPLKSHLYGVRAAGLEMSFEEILKVVGGLPRSAPEHGAWWANEQGRHVQALSSVDDGFQTERADLSGRRAPLRRISQAKA